MQEAYHDLREDVFIEAFRPPPGSRRQAALLLILALMLGLLIIALPAHFPRARQPLMTDALIIGLTGAVTLAAALVVVLLIAAHVLPPYCTQRARRSGCSSAAIRVIGTWPALTTERWICSGQVVQDRGAAQKAAGL